MHLATIEAVREAVSNHEVSMLQLRRGKWCFTRETFQERAALLLPKTEGVGGLRWYEARQLFVIAQCNATEWGSAKSSWPRRKLRISNQSITSS